MSRREKRLDDLVAEIDALTERVGAQGWRLTRLHNDNAGESYSLEFSRGAGQYTKWERLGRQHRFTSNGRFNDPEPLSLSKLIAGEHAELDEAVALERVRSRAGTVDTQEENE